MKKTVVLVASGRAYTSLCSRHVCIYAHGEGSFKSQDLLDRTAVINCISYVDLRRFFLLQYRHTVCPVHYPIRAGISVALVSSDYTSIQQRIQLWLKKNSQKQTETDNTVSHNPKTPLLMMLEKQSQDSHKNVLGYTTKDYFELVDWAGRAIRENKSGNNTNLR